MQSMWCQTNNVVNGCALACGSQLIYVTRMNPFANHARVVASSAVLHFPVWFEDGIMAVATDMVKEGEFWKISEDVDTIMR